MHSCFAHSYIPCFLKNLRNFSLNMSTALAWFWNLFENFLLFSYSLYVHIPEAFKYLQFLWHMLVLFSVSLGCYCITTYWWICLFKQHVLNLSWELETMRGVTGKMILRGCGIFPSLVDAEPMSVLFHYNSWGLIS